MMMMGDGWSRQQVHCAACDRKELEIERLKVELAETNECKHCIDGDYYTSRVDEDGVRTGEYIICPYCKQEKDMIESTLEMKARYALRKYVESFPEHDQCDICIWDALQVLESYIEETKK